MAIVLEACRHIQTSASDVLLADYNEIYKEAVRVCQVRKLPMPTYGRPLDFLSFMTPRELAAVQYCCQLYAHRFGRAAIHDTSAFFFLGDSPWKRLTWSCNVDGTRSVPTYRRNEGFTYSPAFNRWLTSREKFASMGIWE